MSEEAVGLRQQLATEQELVQMLVVLAHANKWPIKIGLTAQVSLLLGPYPDAQARSAEVQQKIDRWNELIKACGPANPIAR